jgi:hypothetical protein
MVSADIGISSRRKDTVMNDKISSSMASISVILLVLAGPMCSIGLALGSSGAPRPEAANGPLKREPFADAQTVLAHFKSMESTQKHEAIKLLHEMGTKDAEAALLAIALGQHGPDHVEWAASRYIAGLEDRAGARRLLAAPDWRVRHTGWLGLRGVALDPQLLQDMRRALESEHLSLRRAASSVAVEAPAGSYSRECVLMLVESLKTVEDAPNVWNTIGVLHGKATEGGYTYAHLTRNLSRIRGVELSWLEPITPSIKGQARDCVLVARGRLADVSVKAELRRMVQQSPVRDIRLLALDTFRIVGDAGDIPYLEMVAESDPLEETPSAQIAEWLKWKGLPSDTYYPVRMAADQVLRAVRKKIQQEEERRSRGGDIVEGRPLL